MGVFFVSGIPKMQFVLLGVSVSLQNHKTKMWHRAAKQDVPAIFSARYRSRGSAKRETWKPMGYHFGLVGEFTTQFRTYFSGWIGMFTGGTIWMLQPPCNGESGSVSHYPKKAWLSD